MSIRNVRIGMRLGMGFFAVLLLLCLVALLGLSKIRSTNDNVDYFVVNILPSIKIADTLHSDVQDLRRFEVQHLMMSTGKEMDDQESRIAATAASIEKALKSYDPLVSDDTDRANLAAVRDAYSKYRAIWERLRPISRQTSTDPSKIEDAKKLLFGDSRVAFTDLTDRLAALRQYNETLAQQGADDAASGYKHAIWLMLAFSAGAVALGAIGALVITRSITVPINRAVEVADLIGAGDLRATIDDAGRDETGRLLQALRAMNESLVKIVSQVRASSDSIATGSAQIATGNADLSQRTEEQASSLEETAASMEQMNATVKQNADTAQQATQLANSASNVAAKGGAVVSQVISTMDDITASSRKINDIIGVIDGIAFQTNILALNAAVEAARAGEQGRGFAVVAGEVRTLAQRSAQAAREIKALIGQSVEKVDAGSRLVSEAGTTMDEIVAQVKRVADLIGEIGAATREQTTGIGQVSEAVTQLDQVTQQNAALVEQSAAAAESLKQQAAQMTQVVGVFKLDRVSLH